jgi:hypothetical protein
MCVTKQVVSHRFYPSQDEQTTLRVNLWRSDRMDLLYCDEAIAQRAATLEVDMSDLSGENECRVGFSILFFGSSLDSQTQPGGLNRAVQVDMSFGRTHIKVVAFDVRNGTRVSTRLNFLDKELSILAPAVKS